LFSIALVPTRKVRVCKVAKITKIPKQANRIRDYPLISLILLVFFLGLLWKSIIFVEIVKVIEL